MAQFRKDQLEMFLGAVRKYMQVRGPMSQKDLAEATDTGVSTMSRFLNLQTKELNPQLIAKIAAYLQIPLHEIIDFVDEGFTEQFIRLVKFYKGDDTAAAQMTQTQTVTKTEVGVDEDEDDILAEALDEGGKAGGSRKGFDAGIKIGNKKVSMPFREDNDHHASSELKDKLKRLSLKQKGFLNEFLNLDSDGRDLVADVGRNIISYLRQKGIDF